MKANGCSTSTRMNVFIVACEPVCPVDAIYYEDDLPEKWHEYAQVNLDFFHELGSPGDASKMGKAANDPPFAAKLPTRAADR
jgi:ferredoxin